MVFSRHCWCSVRLSAALTLRRFARYGDFIAIREDAPEASTTFDRRRRRCDIMHVAERFWLQIREFLRSGWRIFPRIRDCNLYVVAEGF